MAVAVSAIAVEFGVSVLTVISTAGAALSVVGAVTGDKGLMQIGGAIGLIGGIGGLASGAFGAASGVASGTADAVGGAVGPVLDQTAAETARLSAGSAATDAISSGATVGTENAIGAATNGAAPSAVGSNVSMPGSDLTLSGGAAPPPIDPVTGLPNTPGVQQLNPTTGASAQPMSTPSTTSAPSGLADAPPATQPVSNDILDTSSAQNGTSYGNAPTGPGTVQIGGGGGALSNIIGKLGDAWHNLPATTQSQITKSILAMPQGIQTQKNKDREFALQQQKVNQTSYGSSVPRYGILSNASKG